MTKERQIRRAKEVFDIEIAGLKKTRDSIGKSFTDAISLLQSTLENGGLVVVTGVGKQKNPNGEIQGNANVFIFPDLQAGNIAYKVAQRIGGADAIGPNLQGLAKAMNDLSRGCSADDIVATVAVTMLQSTTK